MGTDRRAFLRTACTACLGGLILGTALPGCQPARILTVDRRGADLVVPLSALQYERRGKTRWRRYVVVHHSSLPFPVCVYPLGGDRFSALYMRCTHQGAELQVFGDMLQCPAHGSEFTNTGQVAGPPAVDPLVSFPVRVAGDTLQLRIA